MANNGYRNGPYPSTQIPMYYYPNAFSHPYMNRSSGQMPHFNDSRFVENPYGTAYRPAYPSGQPSQYAPYSQAYPPPQTYQGLAPPAPSPQYLFTEPDVTYPLEGGVGQRYHVHEFKGVTSTADGHTHNFIGTTEPGADNEPNHTHLYWAVTEYKDGHRHELQGRTGPAIPVEGGKHVHLLQGETFGYPHHQHQYKTRTEPSRE